MTTDPRTAIRDKVAEAIYTDSERLFPEVFPWSKLSAPGQDGYRKLADAAIAAHLEALEQGWLFTAEDARMFRLSIDWIASEMRDQEIPPGEYVGTRTFLNGMITRLDQYTALVGSETPWVSGRPSEEP